MSRKLRRTLDSTSDISASARRRSQGAGSMSRNPGDCILRADLRGRQPLCILRPVQMEAVIIGAGSAQANQPLLGLSLLQRAVFAAQDAGLGAIELDDAGAVAA